MRKRGLKRRRFGIAGRCTEAPLEFLWAPIDQDKFGQRKFQAALTALKIRHRDFYHTRHTFVSAMLTHDENPKRIAEYVGNSPEMIYRRYGKWIGSQDGFGETALRAGKKPAFWPVKSEPLPEPTSLQVAETEEKQVLSLVEATGIVLLL